MGKYRQDERIAYTLSKSYDYLENVSDEFKEGYKAAISYVNNQVAKNTRYYARRNGTKGVTISECIGGVIEGENNKY